MLVPPQLQSPQPPAQPSLPLPVTAVPSLQQPLAAPPAASSDEAVEEWFYRAKANTYGPFSVARLRTFKPVLVEKGKWGALKVWRAGQTEADAILIAHLLPDATPT